MVAICLLACLMYFLDKANFSFALGLDDLVTTWDSGTSATIQINFRSTNVSVDWGDGTTEAITTVGTKSHTYPLTNTNYQVRINGNNLHIRFCSEINNTRTASASQLLQLNQWGTGMFANTSYMFRHCDMMEANYSDSPNTTNVKDMAAMFYGAKKFNGEVNFDTQNVVNMLSMFQEAEIFNQPVNFDTSKVYTMAYIFMRASAFNQPVNFNTQNVPNMTCMFYGATSFNQPINFDTRNVFNMASMFQGATSFNSPLSFTDTGKVISMTGMFNGALNFNQPISFDTKNVLDMSGFLNGARNFNSTISFTNTSKVSNMNSMFRDARAFNKPVDFDTRSVTSMQNMFTSAIVFNQPVNFDTGNVVNMSQMFANATAFNQPVNFDTKNVTNMSGMFRSASSFNQPVVFDTSKLTKVYEMFFSATAFDQDISGFDFSNALGNSSASNSYTRILSFASSFSVVNTDKFIKKIHSQHSDKTGWNIVSTLNYCHAEPEILDLRSKGWIIGTSKKCSTYPEPSQVDLSNRFLQENSPVDTQIGTLRAIVADAVEDSVTFSLGCSLGFNNTDNTSFAIINNTLISKIIPDYEAKNTYNICIKVLDTYTNKVLEKNLKIEIIDVSNEPATLSINTSDMVSININPTSSGTFNKTSSNISVSTTNPTGYKLSFSNKNNDTALHHINNLTTPGSVLSNIASITSNLTESGFTNNSWGYSLDDINYSPIPNNSNPIILKNHSSTANNDTTNIIYGVKVDNTLFSGIYQDVITYTVVANSSTIPTPTPPNRNYLSLIDNLQDQDIKWACQNTYTPTTSATISTAGSRDFTGDFVPEARLRDNRDNKQYVIRKLADGNCWMTQNLDLDLSTDKAFYAYNTNLTSRASWTPNRNTVPLSIGYAFQTNEEASRQVLSADIGNIYYNNGTIRNTSGLPVEHAGNYYNFLAATAGSGVYEAVDSNTFDSICASGWMLPNYDAAKSYAHLLWFVYGFNNLTQAGLVLTSPFSFVASGKKSFNDQNTLTNESIYGSYWQNRSDTEVGKARSYVIGPNAFDYHSALLKGDSRSIRCILK